MGLRGGRAGLAPFSEGRVIGEAVGVGHVGHLGDEALHGLPVYLQVILQDKQTSSTDGEEGREEKEDGRESNVKEYL